MMYMPRALDPTLAYNLHCPHPLRISKSKKCGLLVGRMEVWGGGRGRSRAVLEPSCAPCAAAGKIDVGARSGIDGCLMQINPPSVQRRDGKRVMFGKAGRIVTTPLNAPPATSVHVK
jgi:hypothetical protein